jgi:hypothetical protein
MSCRPTARRRRQRRHSQVTLLDGYTVGDHVLYDWQPDAGDRKLLYGVPLDARREGQAVPLRTGMPTPLRYGVLRKELPLRGFPTGTI